MPPPLHVGWTRVRFVGKTPSLMLQRLLQPRAPQERGRWEFDYNDSIVTALKPEMYLPAGSERICFHSRKGIKSNNKGMCSAERPCGKIVDKATTECSNPVYRHLGVCSKR